MFWFFISILFDSFQQSASINVCVESWPQCYKTFCMLSSVEYEILNAHKYKNIKKIGLLDSDKPIMLYFPLIHVKMPTIVGILTCMSGNNFMLSGVEHEKVL